MMNAAAWTGSSVTWKSWRSDFEIVLFLTIAVRIHASRPPQYSCPIITTGNRRVFPFWVGGSGSKNSSRGADPAGHDDVPRGVFDEHDLARKEVLEVERLVLVPVHPLLFREHDVEPDGEPLAA